MARPGCVVRVLSTSKYELPGLSQPCDVVPVPRQTELVGSLGTEQSRPSNKLQSSAIWPETKSCSQLSGVKSRPSGT